MENLGLGKLIYGYQQRDAVHIAVAPVEAIENLRPGQWVYLINGKAKAWTSRRDTAVGVVDPFLPNAVKQGERFWLYVWPGSILSLRHEWSHPSFPLPVEATDDQKETAMRDLEEFGKKLGSYEAISANDLLEYYMDLANGGDPSLSSDTKYDIDKNEYWRLCEVITGIAIPAGQREDHYFRCNC